MLNYRINFCFIGPVFNKNPKKIAILISILCILVVYICNLYVCKFYTFLRGINKYLTALFQFMYKLLSFIFCNTKTGTFCIKLKTRKTKKLKNQSIVEVLILPVKNGKLLAEVSRMTPYYISPLF